MKRIFFTKKETDKYIAERKTAPCFICEIVNGKSLRNKHRILYEDEQVISFLSLFPTQHGQTLVCPKRHVEQVVQELREEDYLYLHKAIYRIAKAVQKVTKPERLYIASFGSNQMNRHIHFHIVPIPKGVSIREQQMASMMPEIVGLLVLEEGEWRNLAQDIKLALPLTSCDVIPKGNLL